MMRKPFLSGLILTQLVIACGTQPQGISAPSASAPPVEAREMPESPAGPAPGSLPILTPPLLPEPVSEPELLPPPAPLTPLPEAPAHEEPQPIFWPEPLPETRPAPEQERLENLPQLESPTEPDAEPQLIYPLPPTTEKALPRLNILTAPRNLLNMTTATVPVTAIFEIQVQNLQATHPIATYRWQVQKLGIPFLTKDELIHTATGQRLVFTFQEQAAYRVTGTVLTSADEQASSSVILWGRG